VSNISISMSSASRSRISPRSIGVKLIVVCGLAVSMAIPGFFVRGLIEDRTGRATEVIRQISGYSGGQQTFLGPSLVIPYKFRQSSDNSSSRGAYIVFPTDGSAALKTVTEERRRSLFKVPVFRADLTFEATFDLSHTPSALPPGVELDWDRAELIVGVSDVRGALEDAKLTTDSQVMTLGPAQFLPRITIGADPPGGLRSRSLVQGSRRRLHKIHDFT
jgi:inner membrane protein